MADNKLQLVGDKYLSDGIDNGGGPPDDGSMEARVKALEDTLTAIRSDLDVVKANYATKADVAEIRADIHKAIAENARWTHTAMIGMFSAFVLGVFGLLFTIWNAAKPAATPAAQQASAPIVIQVPATSAPTAPATSAK
ncbi:hypothetical protein [Cupriavidus neocaledonicus]|uniref:hypothetical protein n=1 Tax=Cupriavidus neocaledonicus TaxID=1040979 RepID=UPI000E20062E|nr:hypothetical protein [Cupriavidus neocaledonicus]